MRGSSTVEAALLFPVIFLFCMLFLQYALYFMALEYAEGLCEEALIACGLENADTDTLAEKFMEKADEGGLLNSGTEITIQTAEFLTFQTVTVSLQGSYTLLYTMDIDIQSSGYTLDGYEFAQTADLIWDSASQIEGAESFITKWFEGS